MGVTQLYDESQFYCRVKRTEFCPGQFCWLPVPHIEPVPQILEVERSSPEEHEEVRFVLRNANRRGDFKKSDRSLPIKYLKLRSNEELLIQRAKKRPGIILGSGLDIYPEIAKILKGKGKKHLQEDSIFVIPGYSIEAPEGGSGFPQQQVQLIKCMMYRQFFFYRQTKGMLEGIARFDRIQVVIGRDPAAIEPTEICLSRELFGLFQAMFIFCVTGIEFSDLEATRAIVKDALPSPKK